MQMLKLRVVLPGIGVYVVMGVSVRIVFKTLRPDRWKAQTDDLDSQRGNFKRFGLIY